MVARAIFAIRRTCDAQTLLAPWSITLLVAKLYERERAKFPFSLLRRRCDNRRGSEPVKTGGGSLFPRSWEQAVTAGSSPWLQALRGCEVKASDTEVMGNGAQAFQLREHL